MQSSAGQTFIREVIATTPGAIAAVTKYQSLSDVYGNRNCWTRLRRKTAFAKFAHKIAIAEDPRWRELLILFEHSGYVALFEIEDDHTVTVTAIRHQREEAYH